MPDDTDTDGRWLTYSQIATLRKIDKRSAERLVRRHGWRRQPDNAGFVRVYVPGGYLGPETAPDMGPDIRRDATTFAAAIATFEAMVTVIKGELSRAHDRSDKAEARVVTLEEQLRQAEGTREAAIEAANRADAEAAAARDKLADRERDIADRRARGLVARLRDAWRGRG